MNILLIEPPFYLFQGIGGNNASYGLKMLAATVSEQGHVVKVYSPDLEYSGESTGAGIVATITGYDEKAKEVTERLIDIVSSFSPDVVGVSLLTARADIGMSLAEAVRRKNPDITIVAGGIHATMFPGELLASGVFDYVIRGEGEVAFPELVEAIARGDDPREGEIPGLSFVDEKGNIAHNQIHYMPDIDSLPLPVHEHFINYETYPENAFQSVMFSRGCPYDCGFCASHLIWTRRVRYHSPEYFVDLVSYLNDRYGMRKFRFNDDTYMTHRKKTAQINRLLIQKGLSIEWFCSGRVELVNHEILSDMQAAGLTSIGFGVESADEEIRKKIRKTAPLDVVESAFRTADDLGIHTLGYFMIGLPGETYEKAQRTLDFIERIRPSDPVISIFTPYPGTALYDEVRDRGLLPETDSPGWDGFYHQSGMNFTGEMTDDQWERTIARAEDIHDRASRWREEKLTRGLVRRFTVKKALGRYRESPGAIVGDVLRVLSLIRGRIAARLRR